jgi:photosystem II stability/assembly factor-like uncharacterized protein
MKQIFAFSLIVVLIVIFGACSDDSNPVTSAAPRVFDPFALWDTASGSLGNAVQCLAAKDTFLFAGTSNSGVYRSSNNGETWTQVITNLPSLNICAFLVKDSILFAGLFSDGLYRSTDNGSNWANSGIMSTSVYSLARKDSNLFAGTSSNVLRSTDGGLTWDIAGSFFSDVWALAVKRSKLFAGTYSNMVFRSTDNGSHWTPIYTGFPETSLHSLAVQDTNLFAATDNGVFRSSNDSSWILVNDGLYSVSGVPQSLFVYGSNILAGFSNFEGVYLSLNHGASWISCNAGLDGFSAYAFAYNGSYLFVGGINQGGAGAVWRHAL